MAEDAPRIVVGIAGAAGTRPGTTESGVRPAAILGSFPLMPAAGEAPCWNLAREVASAARGAEEAAALAAKPADGVRPTMAWRRSMSEQGFRRAVETAHAAHAEQFALGGHPGAFVARKGGGR
jgi:hypothetical protein